MSRHLYQAVLRALLYKSTWTSVHYALEGINFDTNIRLLLAQVDQLHHSIPDRDLSVDDLLCSVEAGYRGDLASDLAVYIAGIRETMPAAEATVRELLARKLLDQAATKIIEARNAGRLDVDSPSTLVERAREVSDSGTATATYKLSDFGVDERGPVVPLGISEKLDAVLGGGVGLGELVCFLAPPRRGKTSIMCAAGAAMVRAGYGVLHITMETSAGKVSRLYERAVLRKTKMEWTQGDSAEARTILAAGGGELWIKDLAGLDVTPDSIEGCIYGLRRSESHPIDVVILDYLELMAPARGRLGETQIRYLYGRLGKQVRALARKLGTRVITAWQVNREGSQKDTMTEIDISECWDIFKHVDTMIALNRSAAEKANHHMRLGVLKQREDDDGIQTVNVYCHWARMMIEDLTEENNAIYQTRAKTEALPEQSGLPGQSGGMVSGECVGARRPSFSTKSVDPGIHQEEGP